MARPRKEEDQKAVGLHTTITPLTAEELERRKKEDGVTRSFVVTKALELYFGMNKNDPEQTQLKAS